MMDSQRSDPTQSAAFRREIAAILGWTPSSWQPVTRGYTPAARYIVQDGSNRAFVKVATTPGTIAHMRRELSVYNKLSGTFMPQRYGWSDQGEHPYIVLEDLSGAAWPPPWTEEAVEAVLRTIADLHASPPVLEPYAMVHGVVQGGWSQLASDPRPFLDLGIVTHDWLAKHIGVLVQAEASCSTEGETITHFDLRSDNLCLRGAGAIFVDWGEACLSNPKLDIGFWLPSLAFEGGPPPERLLPGEPEIAAWVAGFFAARAGLEMIADAPFVRRVQKEQLSKALPWACRELGIDLPAIV